MTSCPANSYDRFIFTVSLAGVDVLVTVVIVSTAGFELSCFHKTSKSSGLSCSIGPLITVVTSSALKLDLDQSTRYTWLVSELVLISNHLFQTLSVAFSVS